MTKEICMFSLLTSLLCSSAFADILPITSVDSSSWFLDGDEPYEDKYLIDGKAAKGWVENDSGSGLGSWVELKLDSEQSVSSIRILAGNWYSINEWDYYNRPATLEVSFSDGTSESLSLPNDKSVVEHVLKKPVKTSSVRFTIKKIHSGSAYTDRTAMSEIQLISPASSSSVNAKQISASNTSPENNDGNYESYNLQDGLKDTAWCTPNGDGETLDFNFDSPKSFSSLELINTNAVDLKISMAYARPTELKLQFDDGSETISVKPFMSKQKLDFPKHKSKTVTITLVKNMAGKKFQDSCISEMYLK
jgi:hypothetical protein